jgi:hypothetical protein
MPDIPAGNVLPGALTIWVDVFESHLPNSARAFSVATLQKPFLAIWLKMPRDC